MTEYQEKTVHWSSGINVLAGLWLILSPFMFGFSEVESILWNEVVIGLAVAIFAMFRAAKPYQFEPLSWINFVFGVWLIIAPFILGYSAHGQGGAMLNDIIIGVIIIVLAGMSAITTREATPK